jgi:hypothetical protein
MDNRAEADFGSQYTSNTPTQLSFTRRGGRCRKPGHEQGDPRGIPGRVDQGACHSWVAQFATASCTGRVGAPAAPQPTARRADRVAPAAGRGRSGCGWLAETSPPATRLATRGPRDVGYLVLYGCRILQRVGVRAPPLSCDACPGRGSAGGHRLSGPVQRLPKPRLARVAHAPDADRCGCRAGIRTLRLRFVARLAVQGPREALVLEHRVH